MGKLLDVHPSPDVSSAERGQKGNNASLFGRVILVAVTVGLTLLALEGMTRVVYNQPSMHFGIEMWKYAKALKRTSASYDIGHEHIPNKQAFLMGCPVSINSAGLRDREFSLSKPKGVYRILALGDSTTFGWGAHQDKTWPKLLEQKLNANPPAGGPQHFEVINSGVGNYNTAQEVAYFKERGRLYHPDMVIIGFAYNDGELTPRENKNWLARESYLYVVLSSGLDGLLRQTGPRPNYRDYYNSLYEDGKPGWIACQRAFHDLFTACRNEHIDLRIAIIPELHSFGSTYEFKGINEKIRALAGAADVPTIDLTNGPSGIDPKELVVTPSDVHPNDKAYELFAQKMYTTLIPTFTHKTVSASFSSEGASK
jgi:lysophospholipase L1-like esterase